MQRCIYRNMLHLAGLYFVFRLLCVSLWHRSLSSKSNLFAAAEAAKHEWTQLSIDYFTRRRVGNNRVNCKRSSTCPGRKHQNAKLYNIVMMANSSASTDVGRIFGRTEMHGLNLYGSVCGLVRAICFQWMFCLCLVVFWTKSICLAGFWQCWNNCTNVSIQCYLLLRLGEDRRVVDANVK